MLTNDSVVDIMFPREGLTEAKREREQELTGKEVAKKIAKENGRGLERESETVQNNVVKPNERRLGKGGEI